ncbi:hypothetical protein CWI38_0149p0030 [Hamiltosporidium tvaerminnensis]|uniref:Uncharacterized protein n=1 Tax=Hamiltosporidium tvaerminnensis TaxID=1176355 RepID=A0A4Q9M1L3_9MICR|nr:hypothetical protein CWI38_0149p0030 [Hamiltosporidium tvaerminnensis]
MTAEDCAKSHALDFYVSDYSICLKKRILCHVMKHYFALFEIEIYSGKLKICSTLSKTDKNFERLATCCKKIQGYNYTRSNIESHPTPNLSK